MRIIDQAPRPSVMCSLNCTMVAVGVDCGFAVHVTLRAPGCVVVVVVVTRFVVVVVDGAGGGTVTVVVVDGSLVVVSSSTPVVVGAPATWTVRLALSPFPARAMPPAISSSVRAPAPRAPTRRR